MDLDAATVLDKGASIYSLPIPIFYFTILHRVVRAFLIEEQKIVKKVLAEKMKKAKSEA